MKAKVYATQYKEILTRADQKTALAFVLGGMITSGVAVSAVLVMITDKIISED